MHAGLALVAGGLAGTAIPAASALLGGAGGAAVSLGLGALLGVGTGLLHTVVLRRALARQESGMVAQVSEIGGRVLGVPRPRAETLAGVPAGVLVAAGSPGSAGSAGSTGSAGSAGVAGSARSAGSAGATGPAGGIERALTTLLSTARSTFEVGSLTEAAGDVLVVLGRDGRVRSCSDASSATLGWTVAELRGQPFAGLVHAGDLSTFAALVDGVLAATAVPGQRCRVRVRSARGDWRVLEWAGSSMEDPALVLLAGRDVTDHVRMEADLLHQASHDTLTGLPNRVTLMRLAADAVTVADAEQPLSVLMIDLDRFKDVNDSLGHAIGDQLLAQVGPRLRSALRPMDSIARLGGDEFAVLLPAAGQDGARAVAERLAEALDSPFVVDGMDLHVEASIGIAVSHQAGRPDTDTVEGLLREAEIGMYRAKEEGAGIVLFEPVHDSGDGRSRLELSAELRRGITEGQLVLHYQPVVDVLEGRLAGVEALVRWQHPERGLLAPGAFLPLAEQTGLIIPLSRVVIAGAVRQAALWRDDGHPVQIAVNMSPRWLQHTDVPAMIEVLLAEHHLDPDLLRLEITESVVLAHPQHSLGMLNQLRQMGIGLSLDDFGTGYSSMTHLRNLPVDELKVDRGFVHAMTTSPEDAVIVRAAIELGHNLGMDVVAEGIENADTLAEVVAAGCSLAQGYYFSKALPPDELIEWAIERFPGFVGGEAASRRPRLSL